MAVRHTHQADHRDPHTPDAQTSILGHLSELGLRQDQLPQMLDFQGQQFYYKVPGPREGPRCDFGHAPTSFSATHPSFSPHS